MGGAVALALAAALSAHLYLKYRESQIRASLVGKSDTVEVVVPKRDLHAGERVKEDMVAARLMPSDLAPVGYITPGEFGSIKGLTLKADIPRGTPLLQSLLVGIAQGDTFSSLVGKDERALTFPVDEEQATAHLLRAGDFVDVVLAPRKEGDGTSGDDKGSGAVPLGLVRAHVKVLAAGQISTAAQQYLSATGGSDDGTSNDAYQTITLAVPNSELGRFVAARSYAKNNQAQLLFLLRNPHDGSNAHFNLAEAGDRIHTYAGGNDSNGVLRDNVTRAAQSVKIDRSKTGRVVSRVHHAVLRRRRQPVVIKAEAKCDPKTTKSASQG